MPLSEVVAAGGVVTRKGGSQVLLVHRPKYDDWSFPKGKQERGEHVTTTAVREVREETGLRIVLGRPLPRQGYALSGGRSKTVHYWAARVVGDDDVTGYRPNSEIDDVRWFGLDDARRMLTWADDVTLLEHFAEHPKRTRALVVVRHGLAVPRKAWDGPDPERPLTVDGEAQAQAIAPVLAAYRARSVVSSPSVRCAATVAPYADPVLEPALSEEGADETRIRTVLARLLAGSAAVCTHRPVLPLVLAALDVSEEPLAPGELLVCHHRHDRVRTVERYLPGPDR